MFHKTFCFLLTCAILLLCDFDTAGQGDKKYIAAADMCRTAGQYRPVTQPAEKRHPVISAYDQIIREESQLEGHDWRLLSAIAYSESRFNAGIVSPRGARGLMQIMPAVARQYDVEESRLMDPRTNVRLAARILTRIEKGLRLSTNTPQEDRTRIILASYNSGIGHVRDARKLAAKYGADPDRWTDVSTYLRLKADPAYVEDEVVKCGAFTGSSQTLAFVDGVMGKYNSYCRKATR